MKFENFTKLLFSQSCPFCNNNLSFEQFEKYGCCKCCFLKARLYINGGAYAKEPPEFLPLCSSLYCVGQYVGLLKDAIIRYKFNEENWIAKSFAQMSYNILNNNKEFPNIDIISCIPLSDKRFSERGFNQSEVIAKKLSKLTGIPFIPLFERINQNKTQSKSIREERIKTSEEKEKRFKFSSKGSVTNMKILLIDDILTTGATLNECIDILQTKKIHSVKCLVIASGRRDISE